MTLFADEHPEALQVLADSTIRVADGLDERLGWQLRAGRVGIVNGLQVEYAATIMLRISAEHCSTARPDDVYVRTVVSH